MRRIKEHIKTLRKVFIFLIFIITGISVSLFMGVEHFTVFLKYTAYVAIGFFTGNGLEHIANKMRG